MSSSTGSVRSGQGVLARLALLPARVAGRFRPELTAAADLDEARFAGSRIFPVLALLALAYPIVASVAHAYGSATINGGDLYFALRPTFDVVYSESLTFMLGGIGLGLISPPLGVLFMAVFIPADLLAADTSGELVNLAWQIPFTGLLGRLASLGLLWIAVVEIPLRARSIAAAWASRGDGAPATPALALAYVVLAAVLVFTWTTAIGLLVTSVFTWGPLQQPQNLASDPTWYLWPFLVGGAAVCALLGVILPRPLAGGIGAFDTLEPTPRRPSMPGTILRQAFGALVLALLAGALITDLPEAIVVIGGFLLAGPGLTILLRLVPTPAALGRVPPTPRWLAAIVVAAIASVVLTTVFWDALDITSDLGFALTAMIVVLLFRITLSLGTPAPWQEPRAPDPAAAA